MKLYMWKNVLAGYYSCGVMFAIANSIEETKELISPGYSERIVQYNNGINTTSGKRIVTRNVLPLRKSLVLIVFHMIRNF